MRRIFLSVLTVGISSLCLHGCAGNVKEPDSFPAGTRPQIKSIAKKDGLKNISVHQERTFGGDDLYFFSGSIQVDTGLRTKRMTAVATFLNYDSTGVRAMMSGAGEESGGWPEPAFKREPPLKTIVLQSSNGKFTVPFKFPAQNFSFEKSNPEWVSLVPGEQKSFIITLDFIPYPSDALGKAVRTLAGSSGFRWEDGDRLPRKADTDELLAYIALKKPQPAEGSPFGRFTERSASAYLTDLLSAALPEVVTIAPSTVKFAVIYNYPDAALSLETGSAMRFSLSTTASLKHAAFASMKDSERKAKEREQLRKEYPQNIKWARKAVNDWAAEQQKQSKGQFNALIEKLEKKHVKIIGHKIVLEEKQSDYSKALAKIYFVGLSKKNVGYIRVIIDFETREASSDFSFISSGDGGR